MFTRLSFALAIVAVFTGATPRLHAQCSSWTGTFALSPAQAEIRCTTAFDDGQGELLYVGLGVPLAPPPSTAPDVARIVRWTGSKYDVIYDSGTGGLNERRSIIELAASSAGGTHALYAVELRDTQAAQTWYVRRWSGGTWTQLGAFNDTTHIVIADDGSGPALVAGGSFTLIDGAPVKWAARWNGSTWTSYGSGPPRPLTALKSFDDGNGSRLYAGCSASTQVLWQWNTLAWVQVGTLTGTVNALEVFDAGNGAQLYAGGTLANGAVSNKGLMVLSGGPWQHVPGPIGNNVRKLRVGDVGGGARLFIGTSVVFAYDGTSLAVLGNLSFPAALGLDVVHAPGGDRLWVAMASSFASGRNMGTLASWDGSDWHTPGRGFFIGQPRDLQRFDDGTGPALYATSQLMAAYDSTAYDVLLRWDGSAWSPLFDNIRNLGNALAVSSVSGTPSLYVTGNFVDSQSGVQLARIARRTTSSWAPLGGGLSGMGTALLDFNDGSGAKLIVGGDFLSASGTPANHVAAWDGASWNALGQGLDQAPNAFAAYDDGNGADLYAAGAFSTSNGAPMVGVARWDGTNWSALGAGVDATAWSLAVYRGELWAGGLFTHAGGQPVGYLARWNGTSWSDAPGGGANGGVVALHVHDDGRGPALYVAGAFNLIGGASTFQCARFDGTSWETVDGGVDGLVLTMESFDDDGDGDDELFAAGAFQQAGTVSSGHIARLAGCPHYASFCAGDGALADHTTPCPCGNDGAAGHGCASSVNVNGALLTPSGSTQLDTVVLAGSGMPLSAYGLYLQHDAQDDRVFHDGVLCAGGNLLRLRNRNASGGASSFPDPSFTQDATLTLSQRGFVTPGSGATRYYSVFYRSPAATFCPPATANVTNGVRVIW